MFSGFLHGIEIIETTVGPLPVTVVRSGVIGLIGTAPVWASPTRPPWYIPPSNATVPAWLAGDALVATFPLWNQSAVYVVGDCAVDANGNVQQVTVPGTSDASAPSWSTTLGGVTTDSGVSWKLVQLAPQYKQLNQMVLVNGSADAAGFGPRVRGYTIPYALRAIQLQGAGQVIVVNVFDRNAHVVTVTDEDNDLPGTGVQKVFVGHMGISNVKVTGSVAGIDFRVDTVNGVIYKVSGGNISDGATLVVSYQYADPANAGTGVVRNDVIGVAGPPQTGFELLPFASSQLGFGPKILISPGFSQADDVATQMRAIATRVRGIAIIDTPGGLNPIGGGASSPAVAKDVTVVQTASVADAIADRADLTTAFSAADQRAVLLYPNLMFTDGGVDPLGDDVMNPTDGPYSAWWAGACAANDLRRGYWDSPSNIVLLGPLGPDVPFVMSATDPTSDSNNLNAAGVVTTFTSFATGLRVWGNRNSAFPSTTDPAVFISVRRTLDVIEDSLEIFSLQFLDRPISNALIISILQSVNGFVRLLIQRGALVPGSKVTYDPNNNPPVQLTAGQIVFDIDLMPPPPAERITYNFHVNVELLANIGGPSA